MPPSARLRADQNEIDPAGIGGPQPPAAKARNSRPAGPLVRFLRRLQPDLYSFCLCTRDRCPLKLPGIHRNLLNSCSPTERSKRRSNTLLPGGRTPIAFAPLFFQFFQPCTVLPTCPGPLIPAMPGGIMPRSSRLRRRSCRLTAAPVSPRCTVRAAPRENALSRPR